MFTFNQTCPDCNAPAFSVGVDVDSEGHILQHVNGGRWEWVKFGCGRIDKFIPNFGKVQTECPCRNRPEVVQVRRARQEFLNSVLATTGQFEVDDEFRALVRQSIERLNWHL